MPGEGDPGALPGAGPRVRSPGVTLTPDDLVEIELIKRLKYRYARCLDLKRWDEIAECFTPDAVATYSGGAYTFEGREAIVDFLRRSMGAQTFHSSHKMHHPEIDLTGAHTARGVWALDDVVVMTDLELTIRGCSFYEDEYVKLAGAWRIRRTGYKRVFEEIQPRGNVEGLRLTASWWATGGRSELPAG
ncbi:MAG: bile-acid 7-alpha-dehydratase [Acidimicrobiia bacterium]|nr:MAG: bile-acid 7-alpha-dehydratase [Acidimicrobiia bacterium]